MGGISGVGGDGGSWKRLDLDLVLVLGFLGFGVARAGSS